MPADHIRVVRGTYDPAQLTEGIAFAKFAAREVRKAFPNFERLETYIDRSGHFQWVFWFRRPNVEPSNPRALNVEPLDPRWKPVVTREIAFVTGLEDLANKASISFGIDESSDWFVTSTGRGSRTPRGMPGMEQGG